MRMGGEEGRGMKKAKVFFITFGIISACGLFYEGKKA